MTKICSLAMRLANPIPWSFKALSKVLKANEALLAGEADSGLTVRVPSITWELFGC
jgi:hypothetical protein